MMSTLTKSKYSQLSKEDKYDYWKHGTKNRKLTYETISWIIDTVKAGRDIVMCSMEDFLFGSCAIWESSERKTVSCSLSSSEGLWTP